MRFFSSLIVSFTLLLSVNAAAVLNKRAAAKVEACVRDSNIVSTQLDALQSSIQAGAVFDAKHNYDNLHNAIKAAQSFCCSIDNVISDANATYFLGSFAIAQTKALSLLSLITEKVNDYNFLVKLVVQGQINDMDLNIENLDSCFVIFTPPKEVSVLQEYIDGLKAAFVSTRTAYNMKRQ